MDRKYATFWPRFGAAIIDGLLLWPLDWLDDLVWGASPSPVVLVIWHVLSTFSFLAYSILLHGIYGRTVGKAIMGVRVVDVSETRLSMTQAVLRDSVLLVITLFAAVYQLPDVAAGINPSESHEVTTVQWIYLYANLGWFVLELTTMLLNPKRRAIHDFIAGSVVIRD